jgi:hypothetical protein
MSGSEGRVSVAGHRHGSRTRSLTGTFGPIEIAVPRARLTTADGKTTEWKSQTLRAYQAAVKRFVVEHNTKPKPFTWTADPDKIICAVKRGHQVLDYHH